MKCKTAGFTLVEIMISLAILSVGLLSLYTAQGNSLRASGNAEKIQVAAMLAREKMTEKMMEINEGLEKGAFPDDKEEDAGEFEEPYDGYRWEYKVRKVTIPLAGGAGEDGASEGDRGNAANQAPASAQANLVKMVTKKIEESLREIQIIVIYEDLGTEKSVKVTTHVSKL